MNGRFIQSIKTALSDPAFDGTDIFGKYYSVEEILAMILQHFKDQVDEIIGTEMTCAAFGRPVRFSPEETRDRIAEDRLILAAIRSGFQDVRFFYEPVAASERYATTLEAGSLGLVCDFGGGTSDFSVIRAAGADEIEVLSTHGVRIGGDDLEGEIMQKRLISYFGYGSEYESYGNMLPVPVHIYSMLSRWELIPFLKSMKYRDELRYIRSGAADPIGIQNLIHLIDKDLGYALFRAITQAKHELSEDDHAAVRFFQGGIELKERITRLQFDDYIQGEIDGIRNALIQVIEDAGVERHDVSIVFLTGGSSLVHAIRAVVTSEFPAVEIHSDTDVFNAVSLGLALLAREHGIPVTEEPGY
jgi:hypothetical chaperone protein